jgi:hypothetical protein
MDIDDVKEALQYLYKAVNKFRQGPIEYTLDKLVKHSEALLTRFAPVKEGERAKIVGEVPCSGGWKHCDKTLARGATGRIESVDYRDDHFVLLFIPDTEYWLDAQGC